MNTRSNPLSAPAPSKKKSKKAVAKKPAPPPPKKPAPAKKPASKKRKGEGSTTITNTGNAQQKRQRQTMLTESIMDIDNPADPSNDAGGQGSVNTSTMTADTSTTYLDMEALHEEEQRPTPSSRWMSPSANIVSVAIRRSSPSSSVGGSSIHPSSSTSQRAMTPVQVARTTTSFSQVSSPLCFESSPLRFETTDERQTPTPQSAKTGTPTGEAASANSNLKPRYSSRSLLSPGDLKVTAVLETTCRMLERYLLSTNPFPMESELLAVMRYTKLVFTGILQANELI